MMDTKMAVLVFARKLRIRQAELKKRREGELKKFHAGMAKWRSDTAAWIKANMIERLKNVSVEDVRRRGGYRSSPFEHFFAGAPKPPTYPDDAQLRGVQGMLRHLAITGQAHVVVTTEMTNKYFVDQDEVPDDD
jgi:hypothetical protein